MFFLKRLLLLFLLVLSFSASAETFCDPSLSARWQLLSPSQKQLFSFLYDAAAQNREEIALPAGTAYDDVEPVMTTLLTDFPELCGLDSEWRVFCDPRKPETATGITLSYSLPPAMCDAVLNAARSVTASLPDDPAERITLIHDRLCARIGYDAEAPYAHSAYGALLRGSASCDGYAAAMVLACHLAGIPCSRLDGTVMKNGTAAAHSWNLIGLSGGWVLADLVWDDHPSAVLADALLVTDDRLADTHVRDAESLRLPAASDEALNWHRLTGCYLTGTPQEAANAACELVRQGKTRLRFDDEAALDAAREMLSAGYSLIANPVQRTLTVIPE